MSNNTDNFERPDSASRIARQVQSAPPAHSQGASSSGRRVLWVLLPASLVCCLFGWWFYGRNPEPLLATGRTLLAGAIHDPDDSTRLRRCLRAESLLRDYLSIGGREPGSATLLLAASLTLQNKSLEAEAFYQQADAADCSAEDLSLAAEILFRDGQLGMADKLITCALQSGPDQVPVLQTASAIRLALGRENDALEHCRKLTRFTPADPQPWLTMALIYEGRSQWEHVVEPLTKFIELSPGAVPEHRIQLVGYLTRTRRIGEARRAFDRLAQQAPRIVRENALVEAQLLHAEGNSAAALKVLRDRGSLRGPDAAPALELEGRILVSQSRPKQAIQPLLKAIAIDPSFHEAHLQLGQAYARIGDKEKAEQHLTLQRQLLDKKVRIYRLERLAGRSPADVAVRLELARLCHELGWPDMAGQWQRAAEAAKVLNVQTMP